MLSEPKSLVSVVIPAYNEEKYIGKTLESVQRQTYSSIETIVVDNASTDNTSEISKEYTDLVYRIEEKGIVPAMKYGAEKSNGEYLAFLSADTIMMPDLIEKSYDKINEGSIAAICPVKMDNRIFTNIFIYLVNDLLLLRMMKIPRSFLFLPKQVYDGLNLFGIPEELGEDLHIGRKLKCKGKVSIVDSFAITSSRRQREQGHMRIAYEWLKAWANEYFKTKFPVNYPPVR